MTPRRGCSFLPFLWGCCRWGGPPNFSWVFVTFSFLAVAGSRAPGWWRGASHGRCGGVRWPRGEASRAKADCGRGAVGRLVVSSHGGGVRLLERRGGRRPRWLGWRHPHRATAACGHPGGDRTPIRSSWCQRKTCGCCDCIVHPPLSTSALPVSSWLRKSDAAARTRVAPPPVAAAGGCAPQLSTRPPRRDTACRGEAACVCTSFCPTLGRDAACCSSPRLPSPPPPSPFGVFR